MNTQDLANPSNLTKSYRAGQVERLMESLEAGYENPLEAYVVIAHLQEMLDEMKKKVQPLALVEAAKFAKGDGRVMGVAFSVVSKVGSYKYEHDSEWARRKLALKARETEMQAAYKEAQKGREYCNPDTSEVVPPADVSHTEYIKWDWPK